MAAPEVMRTRALRDRLGDVFRKHRRRGRTVLAATTRRCRDRLEGQPSSDRRGSLEPRRPPRRGAALGRRPGDSRTNSFKPPIRCACTALPPDSRSTSTCSSRASRYEHRSVGSRTLIPTLQKPERSARRTFAGRRAGASDPLSRTGPFPFAALSSAPPASPSWAARSEMPALRWRQGRSSGWDA